MTTSNAKRVLYFSHAADDLYAMVRQAVPEGFELVTLDNPSEEERLAKIADVDAVIVVTTKLTRAHLANAKNLRFLQHQGVGYHDTIDCHALAERKLPLAICTDGTARGVSEHAVMLMLATMKRLPFIDAEMRQGRFHLNTFRHTSYELGGKTVGILGFGRVGQGVAARIAPFGVKLHYHDLLSFPADLEKRLGATRVSFDHLVAESDILTIHVPRTPATQGLIDASVFARMKPTAFLINTARGGIVDEAALVDALRAKKIAGAGLDVFDVEPTKPNDPLYAFPNVVLTPHIAAGTRDAFQTKMRFAFKNLSAYFDGGQPENLVDYVAELKAAGVTF